MYIAAASASVVTGAYFLQQHLEYVKMHTMPPGLLAFDVNGPIPECGR